MRYPLADVVHNRLLFTALISWAIAQSGKVITHRLLNGRWDLGRLFGSGGMPSSHSAISLSLAVGCGLLYGWDSPFFAIGLVFAFVVMTDAAGVRRAAGKQARTLNQILDHMRSEGQGLPFHPEQLRELLGHSPVEVGAGAILGILVALLLCS